MSASETIWQLGASDAPLPPAVAKAQAENLSVEEYLELYRTYGSIFRALRPAYGPGGSPS
jgi:hypothetical protein